jgi:hypothetical protein
MISSLLTVFLLVGPRSRAAFAREWAELKRTGSVWLRLLNCFFIPLAKSRAAKSTGLHLKVRHDLERPALKRSSGSGKVEDS